MASLELIHYVPRRVNVLDKTVHFIDAKRKAIDRFPQIIWENHSAWAEANIWALEQATSSRRDLKTVHSVMSHLLAYAKWLESGEINWWDFPERESERCLTRFRGALVEARNSGEISPAQPPNGWQQLFDFISGFIPEG